MEVVSRTQAFDCHTKDGLALSTPDQCTFNFAENGPFTPNYPAETSMEISVTSVCFPNVITAVQPYNNTFFLMNSGIIYPVTLPITNFRGLSSNSTSTGLVDFIKAAMVAATNVAWTVTGVPLTNTITISAPSTLVGTWTMLFTSQTVGGVFTNAYASACGFLGFKQSDVKTFVASQTVASTVPCQASGASNIYIACDLFSLDSAVVDLYGSTRRGALLAKLNITDAPWTTSTYQDQLQTFSLRLPAYNITQLTVFLLNEYLQAPNMSLDWSFSGTCTYYSPNPIVEINNKLDNISQTLSYIWLSQKHAHEDQKKQARLKAKAAKDFEDFQGRRVN